MAGKKLWKTKPLDSWQKAKEFRKEAYADIGTAHDKGELLFLGASIGGQGWGKTHTMGGEAYGASIANMGLSVEFIEAAEAKGYARDLCSYLRCGFGSMFLDKYAFGGPFPKFDVAMRTHTCDQHAKWTLTQAEYLNIPYHAIEHPAFNEYDSEQTHRNKIEYMIVQELEAIEWAEKTTGKTFNDEAYIEGLYISARIKNLWGQVCLLNQNIPAPLDEKSMFSFCIIGGIVGGNQKKALEVMQMLRDEIEDRVKNEIAAVATERYRIMHAGSPAWYALSIFRYFEKFGALSIGSRYTFTRGGGTILDMGGRELPHQTFEQRGLVLKTREDAVRAVVEEGRLNQETWKSFRFTGHEGTELELRMAKLWKCDGAVLHFNRGCEHQAHGQPQVRLAFVDAGIPVMNYEASMADAREWDEARTFARIDAFFESQGIEKLED